MGSKVFFDAMEKARDFSGAAIREEVMKVDVKAGTTATGWGAKFNEKGQNVRAEPFLMQWRKGELMTIAPEAAAVEKLAISPN
jgi:branched-chain amino acid transport system substrate-binding protein